MYDPSSSAKQQRLDGTSAGKESTNYGSIGNNGPEHPGTAAVSSAASSNGGISKENTAFLDSSALGVYTGPATFTLNAFSPAAYRASYVRLRDWVVDSLEDMQPDLRQLLFPLFEHCYFDLIARSHCSEAAAFLEAFKVDHYSMHGNEIMLFESITNPLLLRENEYASTRRSSRYCIEIGRTAYLLLLSFLEENKMQCILRILNTFFRFQITTRIPSSGSSLRRSIPCPPKLLPQAGSSALHNMTSLAPGNLAPLNLAPCATLLDPETQELVISAISNADVETDPLYQTRQTAPETSPQSPSANADSSSLSVRSGAASLAQDSAQSNDNNNTTNNSNAGVINAAMRPRSSSNSLSQSGRRDQRGPSLRTRLIDIFRFSPYCSTQTSLTSDTLKSSASTSATSKKTETDQGKKLRTTVEKENTIAQQNPTPNANSTQVSSLPLPPVRGPRVAELIASLRDVAYRASISSVSLPSICFFTWQNTFETLNCTATSSDVKLIAGGFSDGLVRVHSLSNEPLRALRPPADLKQDQLNSLTREDFENMREQEGSFCKRLVGHSSAVYGSCFVPNSSRYLLTCSADATVRLWSTDTFTSLACYRSHQYPVWDVDVDATCTYFASASHDRTARLWSFEHLHPLRIYAGHESDVEAVRFHPNSTLLATCSTDKSVRIWDSLSAEPVRIFHGASSTLQNLAFSPDGKKIAAAGEDRYIYLWDIGSGRLVNRFFGHRGLVTSLSFSAEGTILASSGVDCTVRLWDVNSATSENADVAVLSDSEKGTKGAQEQQSNGQPLAGRRRSHSEMRHSAKCNGLLKTFPAQKTAVHSVQFTKRNLLLATGPRFLN